MGVDFGDYDGFEDLYVTNLGRSDCDSLSAHQPVDVRAWQTQLTGNIQ